MECFALRASKGAANEVDVSRRNVVTSEKPDASSAVKARHCTAVLCCLMKPLALFYMFSALRGGSNG